MSTQQQIESYLDLGFSPIPLKGKVANYRWKQLTLTSQSMGKFLKDGANWGLRTNQLKGGLWFYVVDLDNKAIISDFFHDNPQTMNAPLVSTGRGFHIYLTWTEEVKTRHLAGVDVIGNGYVVAPPSIHPNGKRYTFIKPLVSVPPIFDPQTLNLEKWNKPNPPTVTTFVEPRANTGNLVNHESTYTGSPVSLGVPEGQRHNALIHLIGAHINACYREEEALARLLSWNKLNKPPMGVKEVSYTVRACYEKWDRYVK